MTSQKSTYVQTELRDSGDEKNIDDIDVKINSCAKVLNAYLSNLQVLFKQFDKSRENTTKEELQLKFANAYTRITNSLKEEQKRVSEIIYQTDKLMMKSKEATERLENPKGVLIGKHYYMGYKKQRYIAQAMLNEFIGFVKASSLKENINVKYSSIIDDFLLIIFPKLPNTYRRIINRNSKLAQTNVETYIDEIIKRKIGSFNLNFVEFKDDVRTNSDIGIIDQEGNLTSNTPSNVTNQTITDFSKLDMTSNTNLLGEINRLNSVIIDLLKRLRHYETKSNKDENTINTLKMLQTQSPQFLPQPLQQSRQLLQSMAPIINIPQKTGGAYPPSYVPTLQQQSISQQSLQPLQPLQQSLQPLQQSRQQMAPVLLQSSQSMAPSINIQQHSRQSLRSLAPLRVPLQPMVPFTDAHSQSPNESQRKRAPSSPQQNEQPLKRHTASSQQQQNSPSTPIRRQQPSSLDIQQSASYSPLSLESFSPNRQQPLSTTQQQSPSLVSPTQHIVDSIFATDTPLNTSEDDDILLGIEGLGSSAQSEQHTTSSDEHTISNEIATLEAITSSEDLFNFDDDKSKDKTMQSCLKCGKELH